jgi:hypothetical protein
MLHRSKILGIALVLVAAVANPAVGLEDPAQLPNWKGQWVRIGGGPYDPTKPAGRGQQPPLTPEYQKVWESNIAAEANGSQNYNPQARCLPGGMPRMMIAYEPMEVIVTPELTYVLMEFMNPLRRVYTDGRSFPAVMEPTFAGYSIGRWEDTDGSGQLDTLVVETRGIKGPRVYEATGIPFHEDNATIVKERIRLDRADPNVLVNEITTIDNALTRPWVVTRKYRRETKPIWLEYNCVENNPQITIRDETYNLGADGNLMPTRPHQPPPDLKHFDQTKK